MAPNIPEDTIDDAVISTIMGGNDKPIMTATESEGSIVSRGTGAMDPDIEVSFTNEDARINGQIFVLREIEF